MTKFRAVSGIVGLSLIAACGDPNASGLGGSSDRAGATGGTDTGGSSGAGAGGYIEPGTGGGGGTELGSRGGMGQMPHASCSDSVTNGNESDTDCGGFCAPCAVGLACNGASDCDSSSCLSGTCAAPTCTDGARNGDETDADCGGSCDPCADEQACASDNDCVSGVCGEKTPVDNGLDDEVDEHEKEPHHTVCLPANCVDDVKNGTETAVDCGGDCSPCGEGKACTGGSDCHSGVCSDGACAAPRCGDAVKNGSEHCDTAGDTGTCDADCSAATCGDGYVNAAAGEECDDGILGATDGCDDQCKVRIPNACEGGKDHASGASWVVCSADETEAWLSADSEGEYHPELICEFLGYSTVGAWDGTYGSVCGYRESSSCAAPGTKQLTRPWTGVGNCGADELGQKLCYAVQWSCVR